MADMRLETARALARTEELEKVARDAEEGARFAKLRAEELERTLAETKQVKFLCVSIRIHTYMYNYCYGCICMYMCAFRLTFWLYQLLLSLYLFTSAIECMHVSSSPSMLSTRRLAPSFLMFTNNHSRDYVTCFSLFYAHSFQTHLDIRPWLPPKSNCTQRRRLQKNPPLPYYVN